jgi:hypothetical protein
MGVGPTRRPHHRTAPRRRPRPVWAGVGRRGGGRPSVPAEGRHSGGRGYSPGRTRRRGSEASRARGGSRSPRQRGVRRSGDRMTRKPPRGPASRALLAADAVDDLAVDLDDRGSEGGNEGEARIPGTGIVDRETESELSQRAHVPREGQDIGHGLLLGALHGDPPTRDAMGGRHLGERWRGEARTEQAGGVEVDRITGCPARPGAFLLERGDPLEDLGHDEPIELDRPAGADGGLDHRRDGSLEGRHLRPEQALVLVDLAGREVHDRLEDDPVTGEDEEQVEHLRLRDGQRLAHPDPIRDARLLDGRGEGDEIAVRLGDGAIDMDEAEFRGVALPSYQRRPGVGQLGRRGDQADTRFELEQTSADDHLREAVHEADVARPEK